MPVKFKNADEIKDIINEEGTYLSLKVNIDEEHDSTNERLYIMAVWSERNHKIYCKINEFALQLFFQGRISVKELFLLRIDEPYIIEKGGNKDRDNQSEVYYDEELQYNVIDKIKVGDSHYYSIPVSLRLTNPLLEELPKLKKEYNNSFEAFYTGRMHGKQWLDKYSNKR